MDTILPGSICVRQEYERRYDYGVRTQTIIDKPEGGMRMDEIATDTVRIAAWVPSMCR